MNKQKIISKILRDNPWLKRVNPNNLSQRLWKTSGENAFLLWNNIQQAYELHTIEAYILCGESFNSQIDPEYLCQFLIDDYRRCDFAFNADDIQAMKRENERFKTKWAKDNYEGFKRHGAQTLERTIGTKL